MKDLMTKARLEVDEKKKVGYWQDWARLLATYMPFIPYSWPGGTGSWPEGGGAFSFAWPYAKTGVTSDTAKRLVDVAKKAFGG